MFLLCPCSESKAKPSMIDSHVVDDSKAANVLQPRPTYEPICHSSCVWCRGRKREENRASLDGILDGLNLNGSNPIAVMTQDISRSFLAGSNEKADRKKFDIYMEATLMAQSQENYQVYAAHSVTGCQSATLHGGCLIRHCNRLICLQVQHKCRYCAVELSEHVGRTWCLQAAQ